MVSEYVGLFLESFYLWLSLLIIPIFNFSLLWRMLPVYLNGLLATIYFGPSNTAAVFGGLTALWAGADWVRVYIMEPSFGVTSLNWIIAIIFSVYGGLALIVGLLKMHRFYFIFGRRSILTYFAISIYPIQANFVSFTPELIKAIFIVAIPVIVLIEVVAIFLRRYVLRL